MDRELGWFSDLDSDDTDMWQPVLYLGGWGPSLPVQFDTKEECDRFIQEQIIGKPWWP